MITIARSFMFSSAHQLVKTVPEGHKCSQVHGHNWEGIFEITASDACCVRGMILDFSELKKVIQKVIVDLFDHRFICPVGQQPVAFPVVMVPNDPTVEFLTMYCTHVMAHELLTGSYFNTPSDIISFATTLYESRNSYGRYCLEHPFKIDEELVSAVKVLE